ncbi:hypothetical protein KQX54_003550 [Cotesia glomerata]|uniref:Uncharacterized protein n=1 Tax=Cotesia glomerata TaxID=32391 RepID=A0AAV7HUI9_COTGL|nr:hypothetical protein KQX54_003550 [Cotesia glomerata]
MASATTLAILMALAANAVFLHASPHEPSSADTSIKSPCIPISDQNDTWRVPCRLIPSQSTIKNEKLPILYLENGYKYPSSSPLPPPPTTTPKYPNPKPQPSPLNHYIPGPPQQPPFNCYCPGPVPYPVYSNYYPPQYPSFPTYPSSGQRPAPYNNMPSSGPSYQFSAPPYGFYNSLERPQFSGVNNQNTKVPTDPFNMFREPSTTTEVSDYGFKLTTVMHNKTEEGSSTHYSSSSSW